MKLRALAIGSGWGAHAARVFAVNPHTQLAGIVGRGSERTEALAVELGVPWFTELGTAVEALAPEIASVAVHERVNAAMVEALLKARCDVLCSHPVATSAGDVAHLASLARDLGRVVATDYSLRMCSSYSSAREELTRCGRLLRVAIECPSRTLVISVDLALDLAGPVERVFATARYPVELDERRSRLPRAFAPTVLLEHSSGVVTTIVPVPQADPAAAYGVLLSAERASIRLALPAGGARRLQYLGKGQLDERKLSDRDPVASPVEAFATPMRRLVAHFIETVVRRTPEHAPLGTEEAIRRTWFAIERSAAERRPVEVTALEV